jgi:hypothetical protein
VPNNREWAILVWLGVVLVLVLAKKDLRSSFGSVLRTALHPKILVPFAGMLGYVALLTWLGSLVGLWRTSLIKDTIVWVIVSGLALFFASTDAAKQPHFFRKRLAAALGITAFIGFFVNLFVLPFGAELLLQPFLALLVGVSVVAGREARHRAVKRLVDALLVLIGFSLLTFALVELIANWDKTDKGGVLLQLALPIWMTLGMLPFVYLLSLYTTYEKAFGGINFATDDRRARLRAKLALVTKLHFRHRETNAFTWNWARQAAVAPGFAAARQVVADFLKSRRDAEQAVVEEQDRLRRYAGSDEVDADGRRLDRREFKETMQALDWLATCQMGWYRNRGDGYPADLLETLGDDFARQGLPADSGITMTVAKDGQSWYAWRRTVTGWCFAIGAAGPPLDQWKYDGAEPPQGFPGKDPAWGTRTFSDEQSRNWRY